MKQLLKVIVWFILAFSLSVLFAIKCNAQNLFSKNAIITYSAAFTGGWWDGFNDAIVAHDPFPNSQFWSLYNQNSYNNKDKYGWFRRDVLTFTTDGYHLTKFNTYLCYSFAIGFTVADKDRNWKYILEKSAIAFFASRVGHELSYHLIK